MHSVGGRRRLSPKLVQTAHNSRFKWLHFLSYRQMLSEIKAPPLQSAAFYNFLYLPCSRRHAMCAWVMSGTACDEHLMKDQKDLKSIEVYLAHKARCNLSSKDTPKSSRKAPGYLRYSHSAASHLHRHGDKEADRKTEMERGSKAKHKIQNVKKNKRVHILANWLPFGLSTRSRRRRVGSEMNCGPAQVINVNIRK